MDNFDEQFYYNDRIFTADEFEMDEDFENNEEAEQQDEEMDEDEEPPFMDEDEDEGGKIWEFARKIPNEQHLEEWCQTNGGLILAKEKLLTRQFDCPINGCQFKVIFLEMCSMVYTRNEHNHGVENIQQQKETSTTNVGNNHAMANVNVENIQKKQQRRRRRAPNVGDDYVDHQRKIWKFQEQIGSKNVQFDEKDILKEIHKKYGLSRMNSYQSTVNLRCGKYSSKACKYVGIYVKENGCLYTRGQHEHK